jgi:hypothetical protein
MPRTFSCDPVGTNLPKRHSPQCRGYLNPRPGAAFIECDCECHDGGKRDKKGQTQVAQDWRVSTTRGEE